MKRRLTTILAADIVSFSRLIGADEEGILALRRQHQRQIIAPLLKAHGGRVANTAGDSWLIEFPSAVEALRFAIAGQTRIERMNAGLPENAQMHYRIGINLGDVVPEEGDLLGDGVNIAARLEALAPAGGILISRSVRDQVRDRLDLDLQDLGEIEVKNITRPVRAFQVLRSGEPRMKAPGPVQGYPRSLVISAALAVSLIGGTLWWREQPDFPPVDPAAMALALPQRPSIAVLPFRDAGGDAGAEGISDGLTEVLIATLSLAPDMVVMGRATALSYKGRQVAPGQVAQELGVRYVLSGSVLKSGDSARITASLSDAVEGRQLWSFHEDTDMDHILEVQDQIAQKLFAQLQVPRADFQADRTVAALSGDFQTSVLVMQGRDALQRFDLEGHRKAERIWTALHDANPDSALGPYLLAWLTWQRVILGISQDPAGDLQKSRQLVAKALATREWADPYTLTALIEAVMGRYDQAIIAANRAIDLAPGDAEVNTLAGLALYNSGDAARGLEHMLKGMRLEPAYPQWLPGALYPALLEAGRYGETLALAQSVLDKEMWDARAHPQARAARAAAFALRGDVESARAVVRDMRKANPGLTVEALTAGYDLHAQAPRVFHRKLVDAFIVAGVPRARE